MVFSKSVMKPIRPSLTDPTSVTDKLSMKLYDFLEKTKWRAL